MKNRFVFTIIQTLGFILTTGIPSICSSQAVCENQINDPDRCFQCATQAYPSSTAVQQALLKLFCDKIVTKNVSETPVFVPKTLKNKHEHWMEKLAFEEQRKPINRIAIPGSHDSGSYSIDSLSSLDPYADEEFVLFNYLFGAVSRRITTRWAITQDLNFKQQLEAGIRYFDMRTSKNAKDMNEFHLVHHMFAKKVKSEFAIIKQFLVSHPKEVILLDFNHFYNMNEDDHVKFMDMLKTEFTSSLVPFNETIPSLQDLWHLKQQVIVFYHSGYAETGEYFWPGYMIPSPWPNVEETDKLIKYLNDSYQSQRLPKLNFFYVSQGVFTPSPLTVVKHLFSTLREILAYNASEAFLQWLDTMESSTEEINISIVDFVEEFHYIDKILALNSMNLQLSGLNQYAASPIFIVTMTVLPYVIINYSKLYCL